MISGMSLVNRPPRVRYFALSLIAAAVLAMMSARPSAQEPAAGSSARLQPMERWVDAEARRAIADGARERDRVQSTDEARQYAEAVRSRILTAMGGLPDTRAPLNVRITGRLDRQGYRIEPLVFESLPNVFVTASLYVPDGPGPFPALLGPAGHGGLSRAGLLYQHVWATLAQRGVVVLAYDPPGQGERLEYLNPATGRSRYGAGTAEHDHAGQQVLLTGGSIARYFVWDGVRALDYLLTRRDVDPARIGVAGNSGGGTQAAWLGALEPRLSVVDSSCYIASWQTLWDGPGPQDLEQTLPGFLKLGLDFPDMILAAAPRPYLISSAVQDFFPIDGARASAAEAHRLYSLLDAGDHVEQFVFDDPHGWSQPRREAGYRWFGRWWHDDGIAPPEGEVTVETAEAVRATKTGQVSTSFPASRTIFDVNRDRAVDLTRTRPAASVARLRTLLQVTDARPGSIARHGADRTVKGLHAEGVLIQSASGLDLPGVLIHPAGAPRGTVVVANGQPPAANATAGEDLAAAWAGRGYLALAVDVRGAGALWPTRGESGYTPDYQLAADAWLLGTSVVAWQTQDLVAALEAMEREQPSAGARALDASGLTVPAALFAAALHRVDEVRAERGIVSYFDLANTRNYKVPARLFIPGVLGVADLTDAMTLASPTAVHLVSPVRADGTAIADTRALATVLGGTVPANVRLEIAAAADR
jgi:cephalosporin-C deacetylase-like acetyl esterase